MPGRDYDAEGRVTLEVLQDVGVPLAADHYPCGPSTWMRDLSAGLLTWSVAPERIHIEIFGSEPLEGAARAPVDGNVAYIPDPLEPPQDGRTLICCSQPTSDVLEL